MGSRNTRKSGPVDVLAATRDELTRLYEENACLRLENQRPPTLGRAAEQARQLVSHSAEMLSEAGDDGTDAVVKVMVMRETLLSVLQDLQTSILHLQRQVITNIPAPELDRRNTERREEIQSLGGPVDPRENLRPARKAGASRRAAKVRVNQ